MFQPPRCPYSTCPMHRIERVALEGAFCHRYGHYTVKCRAEPVPRFRCKACLRTFSRQTFRMDYYDHKPNLNPALLLLLSQGLGLRQSGRMLELSRRCTELKARKLSRHLHHSNRNLLDQLPPGCSLQMDEMETFENERVVQPLTLPVLIEQESMFILDARPAPIRPSGCMSPQRLARIAKREREAGRRPSRSKEVVRKVLRTGARYCKKLVPVHIDTDEKKTYPKLILQAFGPIHVHRQTSSKLPRNTRNRLFPINHMNAMARYLNGRLRRRSWLCSKQYPFLHMQLELFRAYKNFVRPRFNTDTKTPAMILGLVPEKFSVSDLLGWRQDWGWFSIHPLHDHASIRAVRAQDRDLGQASFQTPVVKRGHAGW